MAEIKSVMMETLSAGQVKQLAKGTIQKNSGSNSFDNYLSTSQKSGGALASKTASKTQSNNVKVAGRSKADSTSDTVSDVNSGKSAKSLDEKSIDKVNEKIADEVKDVLGIDDDTLANAMTALGLSPTDLLESNNLAKLVLFVNGSSDFTDLLTDENMLSQLNELGDILDNLDWEDLTGMSKSAFLEGVEAFDMKAQAEGDVFAEDDIADLSQEIAEDDGSSEIISENVSTEETFTTDTKNVSTDSETAEDEAVATSDDVSDTEATVAVTDTEEDDSQSSLSESEDDMSEVTQEQNFTEDDVKSDNHQVVRNDFAQNLNQAVDDTVQVAKPETVRMQQMVDIVNQVVEKIKVSIGTDSTSMEMQLNPEHLGKLLLNVSSKNGVMTAVFSVQSEEARAALESQMYTLRENLELRELKVDAVEVNVSDFDFSHSDQTMSGDQSKADNGNGKQMKFDFDDNSSEEIISNEEKEAVRKQVMRDNGSQIDFTA